jgi:DNA-binding NarL/FixJ family response regulator
LRKIRLIVIEDNKLLREGISAILNEQKDMQLVSALNDRIKVQDKIRSLNPHVLLLDLGLIHKNSFRLVISLKKEFPDLKIIIWTYYPFSQI